MEELFRDIRRHRVRAVCSLLCVLGLIFFGAIGGYALFVRAWVWAGGLGLLTMGAAVPLVRWRRGLFCREGPYALPVDREDWETALRAVCAGGQTVDEHQTVFSLTRKFQYRILVTRMEAFSKSDYDRARRRANRFHNRTCQRPQWLPWEEGARLMRLNLLQVPAMNDELHRYLSRSAARNLTRVEGILTAALVGNRLYLPPLNGDVDWIEVERYRDGAEFLCKLLAPTEEIT